MNAGDYVLIIVLAICIYTDAKYQKIYNLVTMPALLAAFVFNTYNLGFGGFLFSGKGMLLGIALFALPFLVGGLGAGDVKLLAVVGAFKGMDFVFTAFLLTAILGGIISIALLAWQKSLVPTLLRVGSSIKLFIISKFTVWSFNTLTEKTEASISFPYGFAIVLGSAATYWVM